MATGILAPELVREFVIAAHGDLEKVTRMLSEHPGLLTMAHEWGPGDTETALQAASHVGNAAVAEYLLSRGAPMEIATAAMLGRRDTVEEVLRAQPARSDARGAHGIPLLAHAALSGNVELVAFLVAHGASEGMSFALSNAVGRGDLELARWLLEHGGPDLDWTNYQGKTALMIARERQDGEMVFLLERHGARERTSFRGGSDAGR